MEKQNRMHHALLIQEILFNIFVQCRTSSGGWRPGSDLAALARTCRAFKEPALDVLWEELNNQLPLARCLPQACHEDQDYFGIVRSYSLHRTPTQTEWDILQSYTRRVRHIHVESSSWGPKLCHKSLISLSKAPTTGLLFPNLRSLRIDYVHELDHFLSLPLPSLISLDIKLCDPPPFETFLESLSKTSSGLRKLSIEEFDYPTLEMDRIDPKFICQWQHLQVVNCPGITLDTTTLVHLSRIPTLTSLSFTPGSTFPEHPDSPLVFSNLHRLQLCSSFMDPIPPLLSRTRCPAVTEFVCGVEFYRSKGELFLLFSGVQTSGIGHTLQQLSCFGGLDVELTDTPVDKPILAEDLQPCMSFCHLRRLEFDIKWSVNLTESDLLVLASAWPHLEQLLINRNWGWHTQSGITPDGLCQLLQSCPSLRRIALVIDTRGFTDMNESMLEGLGRPLPCLDVVHVIDSFIDAPSVPAIAAFFSRIMFVTHAITWLQRDTNLNLPACQVHWQDVCQRVKNAVVPRSLAA